MPQPQVPPDPTMLDLIRAFQVCLIRFKRGESALAQRIATLRLGIQQRAAELLTGTLDDFHGKDPEMERETRAYLLWSELHR